MLRNILLPGMLALASTSYASGIAVSPLKLNLKPGQQMTALTVTNTGDTSVLVQARVVHWLNSDELATTGAAGGMMLTPPLFKLAPGAKQLVRIGWQQQTATPLEEQAFRVFLQEVPNPNSTATGLLVTLQLSLPLFAQAANDEINQLDWQWQNETTGEKILLKNTGNRHQRFTKIKVIDANQHVLLDDSRLLYLLPSQSHSFRLATPPAAWPLRIETISEQGPQVHVLPAPTS